LKNKLIFLNEEVLDSFLCGCIQTQGKDLEKSVDELVIELPPLT
jgi:hypothetical protein